MNTRGDSAAGIARGGWMANHPLTGHPMHVVTREWFDEIAARCEELERKRQLLKALDEIVRQRAEAAESLLEEARENESRSEAQAMMWAGRALAAESLLKEGGRLLRLWCEGFPHEVDDDDRAFLAKLEAQ